MNQEGNILVVDDELGPRESLRIILGPSYKVFTAGDGREAMQVLDRVAIDVATVDLKMPGLSGIQLIEKIKQHDEDIETIIVTGYGSMGTAVEGLRLGAFDYISKPFDVHHIMSLIERALERKKAKQKLWRIKEQFLTHVSHEFRTPLSVVMGCASLLLERNLGNLTDEQQKMLEKVYQNSEELLGLIDNVLWLSCLNTGDLSLAAEQFDAAAVIREIVGRYETLLKEKRIDLTVQLPAEGIWLVSDQLKVSRIFQNLFQNAVKFTAKGQIVVKVTWIVPGRKSSIEISDSGKGMTEDEIKAALEPFYRMDNALGFMSSGLGIGLAVARRLTTFLEGNLNIESHSGGTRVLLTLPSQPVVSAASADLG